MYGHNKLERSTTLGQNGLPVSNTLAYWAHSQVTKKIKFCQYGPWGLYLQQLIRPIKLECDITLG
jgi:hypothetical protein